MPPTTVITRLDQVIHTDLQQIGERSLGNGNSVDPMVRPTAVRLIWIESSFAAYLISVLVFPAKAGIQQDIENISTLSFWRCTALDPGLGARTPNRDDN